VRLRLGFPRLFHRPCFQPRHRRRVANLAVDKRKTVLLCLLDIRTGNLQILGAILLCQKKYTAALQISNRAVELDPVNETALNAQANAYTKLRKWNQSIISTQRILATDANNAPTLNLLAQALRFQGHIRESREVVVRILALLPNNAFGQMNAGYGAMEVGDHLRVLSFGPGLTLTRLN
jgi:tetratricopeptide (TPR) repeat protein